MLSDFNCKIFNTDHLSFLNTSDYTFDCAVAKINFDLNALDSLGFHRLICHIMHDENIPINRTLDKIDNLERFIHQSIGRSNHRKFNINVLPAIHLSENVPYINNLSALAVRGTNYIITELPISVTYPDYLDTTINKILYNCKLRPIFTDFETFASIHSETECIEKMINIKNSAFVFSLNSNNFAGSIQLMRRIYDNGNTVLWATGCEHDLFDMKRIKKNLLFLKDRLPESVYLSIMLNAHRFLR